MPQKVCPRCGAQYATLKSATCPQCFAKLIEVDDETAADMAAARAAIESSPEYQQAKAEEDERFRHQSFQACLAVIAMAIAIVVLAVALIVTARRRERRLAARAHSSAPHVTTPAPVQARVEDVMPSAVGSFHREKMDERALLSGTVTLIYHAAYVPASGPAGSTIDVYAIALDRPAAELGRFRDVVQLAALAGTKPRSVTEMTAKPFLYEIVGAAAGASVNDDFNRAWKLRVGAS